MVSVSSSSKLLHFFRNTSSSHFSPPVLCFSLSAATHLQPRPCALRTGSDGGKIGNREAYDSDLLRSPIVSKDFCEILNEDEDIEVPSILREEEEEEEEMIDWEDKILEETVPLVGFVRMLLHSGRYQSGDRLRPDHERTVLDKLLPHHPECEKKIGCGIDHITVGYHPDFESSRCLFIVRSDGVCMDFSYWKCIKGLIRKKYPLYADVFILRHFRRRNRNIGRL